MRKSLLLFYLLSVTATTACTTTTISFSFCLTRQFSRVTLCSVVRLNVPKTKHDLGLK